MSLDVGTNLAVMAVLLLLSGFFSSLEIAIFSISRFRLRRLLQKKARGADALARLKKNPHRTLTTILIGNNLVNVAAAAQATIVALQLFGDLALATATGVMTLLILVFGEITPKNIAVGKAEFIALHAAGLVELLSRLFHPIVFLLEKVTGAMTRLAGARPAPEKITEEEVSQFVAMGAEEGAIMEEEKELIHNVFAFNDKTVEDVMVPRTEIKAVPVDISYKEFLEFMETCNNSRIPVYKNTIDDIVGVLYVKDAMAALFKKPKGFSVHKLMRKAVFVPYTKPLDKMFKFFQQNRMHIAIVIDDYGVTEGLVTLHDVLEELVGDIDDEEHEESPLKWVSDTAAEVQGNTELEEINRLMDLDLESREFDTISGLILEKLGRMPLAGEKIRLGDVTATVLGVRGSRILRVRLQNHKPRPLSKRAPTARAEKTP